MSSKEETEAMMHRTFLRALEYAAEMEISIETALTHFVPATAAALGAYIARQAPELLAQRSPHKLTEALPGGYWHPGDES